MFCESYLQLFFAGLPVDATELVGLLLLPGVVAATGVLLRAEQPSSAVV